MTFQEHFKGKKILVTGGGRGVGKAIVARLHEYGAEVYALSKNPKNLKALKDEYPKVKTICVDLSNWDNTRNALNKLGVMDCLVNNAAFNVVKTAMNTSPEEFDRTFDVNLKAVLNVTQVIAKKMIDAEQPGSIINISSITGVTPFPHMAAYGSSKSALAMLSKCLAVELAPHKIRVNVLEPACMDTDMIHSVAAGYGETMGSGKDDTDAFFNIIESRTPTGSTLIPLHQVVNTILFMLSDLAPQVTGQCLGIDGGFVCT